MWPEPQRQVLKLHFARFASHGASKLKKPCPRTGRAWVGSIRACRCDEQRNRIMRRTRCTPPLCTHLTFLSFGSALCGEFTRAFLCTVFYEGRSGPFARPLFSSFLFSFAYCVNGPAPVEREKRLKKRGNFTYCGV